jgi:hypothetical protein
MFLSTYFSFFWLIHFLCWSCIYFWIHSWANPSALLQLSYLLLFLQYVCLTARIKTTTSSARRRHCLALLNIVLLADVVLYRFLKSAQSRVGKLTATAALLLGEEPPPRLPGKAEWLNGWQRGPHSLFITFGSEKSLGRLPVIKTRFFSYLDGSMNMNPAPQGS